MSCSLLCSSFEFTLLVLSSLVFQRHPFGGSMSFSTSARWISSNAIPNSGFSLAPYPTFTATVGSASSSVCAESGADPSMPQVAQWVDEPRVGVLMLTILASITSLSQEVSISDQAELATLLIGEDPHPRSTSCARVARREIPR